MRHPLCIYVAGPLTPDAASTLAYNVNQAMRAGLVLMRKGHHPLVPHLTAQMDSYAYVCMKPAPTYEDWMAVGLAWLKRADAILYLGPSPGADRELALARELGLRVFRSVEEVPDIPPLERWEQMYIEGHDCSEEAIKAGKCPECERDWRLRF